MYCIDQWFSTGVRGPGSNISGGPQAKHNKLGIHNDIFGVHEENQLRMLFIFKNLISTVIYIILNQFSDLLGMDIPIWVSIPLDVKCCPYRNILARAPHRITK